MTVIDETVFDLFFKGLRDLSVFSTRLKQVTKVSLSHFLLTILPVLVSVADLNTSRVHVR